MEMIFIQTHIIQRNFTEFIDLYLIKSKSPLDPMVKGSLINKLPGPENIAYSF